MDWNGGLWLVNAMCGRERRFSWKILEYDG